MVGKLIKFNVKTWPNGFKKDMLVTEHVGSIEGVVRLNHEDRFIVKEGSTGDAFVITPYNIISFR